MRLSFVHVASPVVSLPFMFCSLFDKYSLLYFIFEKIGAIVFAILQSYYINSFQADGQNPQSVFEPEFHLF